MTGVAMTSRDRKALVLGLAVLAPVLLWRLAISPYAAEHTRLRAELGAESDLLLRELALVEEARADAEIMAELAALLERHGPRLLDGTNGTLELSEYVQRLAGDLPIHFQSIEPRSLDGAQSVLEPFSVAVAAESDLEGFLTLIRYLETGPKLVLLDSLSVSRSGPRNLEEPERLSFRFLAKGFTVPASDHVAESPITEPVAGS